MFNFLSKINKFGGIFFFNNPNTLNYSIYNYFYNKYIINLNQKDEEINFFHENGYLKPNINFKEEVLELRKNLDDDKKHPFKSEFKFFWLINNKGKEIIKNILYSKKFSNLKKKLENYYNLNTYIINIEAARNFPLPGDEHKIKAYSNEYHVDYYIMNYFKIFINLDDVDHAKGPTNLYSKKNSKKFVKNNN